MAKREPGCPHLTMMTSRVYIFTLADDGLSPCTACFEPVNSALALAVLKASTSSGAGGHRSPSPPLPSLPAIRHASSAVGPSGTIRGGTGPYHHLPTGVGGGFRSVSAAGIRDGTSTASGSQHGHDRPGPTPLGGTTSPTMSFASSRRGSGGIRPSDTWGGTIIGAKDGEDIYQPLTWSEMNDLDLVENLSGRERTRQEVLWEIVASEERYVDELLVSLFLPRILAAVGR